MRLTTRRLAPSAIAVCALMLPASSWATSTAKQVKTARNNGVAYLKSVQQTDGSFPGFGGDWTLGALAAAGTAAADVRQAGGSADARTYYRGLFGDTSTWPGGNEPPVTEFERAALNSYASGVDPARVSTRQNLIAQVVARYQPSTPGYYGGASNFSGALFGLLALADSRTRGGQQRVPQALLDKSVAVVRANQHNDGGWTFEKAEGNPVKLALPSEPDETGASMAALCTAGIPSTDPSVAKARNYLESNLDASTGAFNAPFGQNTDSNAWGVQGLNACGIDPQGSGFTTSMGRTPIDFLISQQVAGGAFKYSASESTGNEYSSQDAVRAISGGGFTAKPPNAKSGPRWVFDSSFQTGVPSLLTLVVDDGTPGVRACAVSLSPEQPTTTLAALLQGAQSGATPAGCVSSFAPASGNGPLTQVNGSPSPPEARWSISVDGGLQKTATRASKIKLGDTISLRLN